MMNRWKENYIMTIKKLLRIILLMAVVGTAERFQLTAQETVHTIQHTLLPAVQLPAESKNSMNLWHKRLPQSLQTEHTPAELPEKPPAAPVLTPALIQQIERIIEETARDAAETAAAGAASDAYAAGIADGKKQAASEVSAQYSVQIGRLRTSCTRWRTAALTQAAVLAAGIVTAWYTAR